MKIILFEDVLNLGKRFEIKEVKPGYARNFLIPKKLALPVNPQNLALREGELQKLKRKMEMEERKREEMLERLKNFKIEIGVKVGTKGELFEKIDAKKIAERLKAQGFELKKENVKLKEEMKKRGIYKVPIEINGHKIEMELILKTPNPVRNF